MPMLRTHSAAGTRIWPTYKTGQLDMAHSDKQSLNVFIPHDGSGCGWACMIDDQAKGVVIIIDTPEDLLKLITALEIAWERVKSKDDFGNGVDTITRRTVSMFEAAQLSRAIHDEVISREEDARDKSANE